MPSLHSYRTEVVWTGAGATGTRSYTAYSRDHDVVVEGRPVIAASADPAFRGDPARYSPEQLFVASLSECHMLWFLHMAATAGLVVRTYSDEATGTMRVESGGAGEFVDVTLHPAVVVDDGALASDGAVAELHRRAHEHCFLARSVSFPVLVEPAPVRLS